MLRHIVSIRIFIHHIYKQDNGLLFWSLFEILYITKNPSFSGETYYKNYIYVSNYLLKYFFGLGLSQFSVPVKEKSSQKHLEYSVINRPGVAGAVLQTTL